MSAYPFASIRENLSVSDAKKRRIKHKLMNQIDSASAVLRQVNYLLTPDKSVKKSILSSVLSVRQRPVTALEQIAAFFTPSERNRAAIKIRSLKSLGCQPCFSRQAAFRWVTAFVITAVCLRLTPMMFMSAPQTAASPVSAELLPPEGEVSILNGSTWEEVKQLTKIESGDRISTQEGSATIVFKDGVLRLSDNSEVIIHDNRTSLLSVTDAVPTVSLINGKMWLAAFVPAHLAGFQVLIGSGEQITVHEASLSVIKDQTVKAEVLDRRVLVTGKKDQLYLIEGEYIEISAEETPLTARTIHPGTYFEDWYQTNLAKDAVHRREIAREQTSRLAGTAGILPTSTLHSVKKIAEEFDKILTISGQTKAEKELQQANTRLSEAAALLNKGETGKAERNLQEYSDLMEKLIYKDEEPDTQAMIQDYLDNVSLNLAATLPADDHYPLKETILNLIEETDETDASLAVRNSLLMDAVDLLATEIQAEEISGAEQTLDALKPYIDSVLSRQESPYKRELQIKLNELAEAAGQKHAKGALDDSILLDFLASHKAAEDDNNQAFVKSQEEYAIINNIIQRVTKNISLESGQKSQLHYEMLALESYPPAERLRILRKLQAALPAYLKNAVRQEVRSARISAGSEM